MYIRVFSCFNFCDSKKLNVKFIDIKKLNERVIIANYDDLLKTCRLPDDEQGDWCVPYEVEDVDMFFYADFQVGLEKSLDAGINVIQIKGEPKYLVSFTQEDIDFISDTSESCKNDPLDKPYTPNITIIKENLYKDLLQVDALTNLQFLVFIPYLDNNNYFYYTVLVGLKNPNFEELNKIQFNLLENVSFVNLQKENFSYDFFKKL